MLPPDRELPDDRSEIAPCRGQLIAPRFSLAQGLARNESGADESVESLCQQGGRNSRHAAVNITKVLAPVDQSTDHEQRPALAQDFSRQRQWAILSVAASHGSPSLCCVIA